MGTDKRALVSQSRLITLGIGAEEWTREKRGTTSSSPRLAIIAITDDPPRRSTLTQRRGGKGRRAGVRGRVWVEKPELFMKCTTGRGTAVGPPI